jgi:hypothetical protein
VTNESTLERYIAQVFVAQEAVRELHVRDCDGIADAIVCLNYSQWALASQGCKVDLFHVEVASVRLVNKE